MSHTTCDRRPSRASRSRRALHSIGVLAFALMAGTGAGAAWANDAYPPLEACGVQPLVAGGGKFGTLVGRVLADPDGFDLKITFDTSYASNYDFGPYIGHFPIPGDWSIKEVHAHAACLMDDSFPVNKQGNPTVGRFSVNEKPLFGTQSYTVTLEDFGSPDFCPGGIVYVAAHATVTKPGVLTETAWGVEFPFAALTGASQWAQFFEVELNNCADSPGQVPLPPSNSAPVANNDVHTYANDLDYTFFIGPNSIVQQFSREPFPLSNDSDPDGDTLTVASVNGTPIPQGSNLVNIKLPSGASLIATKDGAFAYNPGPTFKGDSDSFTYTVTDGLLTSAPATVTIYKVTPPPPAAPMAAQCYQCDGLACLLNPVVSACPDVNGQVQDVCATTVVDGAARQISRGCAVSGRDAGSTSTLPAGVGITPGAIQDQVCYDIEDKLLGNVTCTFVSDGRAVPGSNAPPNLIPTLAPLNPKP